VPTLCNATMSTPLDQRTELLYAAADIDRRIDAVFEGFFVGADATEQASRCDDHELAPWFLRWLPEHQPILEAGFGTGRWLAWFEGQAWRSVGIEPPFLLNRRVLNSQKQICPSEISESCHSLTARSVPSSHWAR